MDYNTGLKYQNKKNNNIEEVFIDNATEEYCFYNHTKHKLKTRTTSAGRVLNIIRTKAKGKKIKKKEIENKTDNFDLVVKPLNPMGENPKNLNEFNLFNRSEALGIIQGAPMTVPFEVPLATLKYYYHIMPLKADRDFFFGFLKRKLQTFDPTNTCLVTMSECQGSGKGLLIGLLNRITAVKKIPLKTFMSGFEDWLEGSFLINVNEVGKRLKSDDDKNEFYEILKEVGEQGDKSIGVKHADAKEIENLCTFIISSNFDPFLLEQSDRRIRYFNFPEINIETVQWFINMGGSEGFMKQTEKEQNHFAYWLRNTDEFPDISDEDYKLPPSTKYKTDKQNRDKPSITKIMEYLETFDYSSLLELAIEKDIRNLDEFREGWDKGKISKPQLYQLLDRNERDIDLSNKLIERFGNYKRLGKYKDGSQPNGYFFPELLEYSREQKQEVNTLSQEKGADQFNWAELGIEGL